VGLCGAARDVAALPDKKHQDSLWAGLQSGSLQVVATDHCAFTTEQKRMGVKDFHPDPQRHRRSGGPHAGAVDGGVETGRLTKEEFVAVTSTNIARILNMYPQERPRRCRLRRRSRVWDPKLVQDSSSPRPAFAVWPLKGKCGKRGAGPSLSK
jgi:dihydropyrimidinase